MEWVIDHCRSNIADGQVAQPTTIGLQSILTILGCQPTPPPSLPTRRGSDVAGRGFPLEKVRSQPLASTSSKDSASKGVQEGKAIWFSTREETLSQYNPTDQN